MGVLRHKLLREVWTMRGQLLSIAAVVAVGIMTVLTMRGSYESLVLSRDLYYRDARFPDVWAQLERAPESVRARIEGLDGVAAVQTRVTFLATLQLDGLDAPALGRFVSIPEERRAMLADLHMESGRYLARGRRDEVIVSKNFAEANAFGPGDTLRAVINGRLRDLRIVGTAISPEYTYAVPPGALYPDDQRYGIVWMSRDALGPAYDMDGAFNEVVVSLAPGATEAHVLARLDRLLERYGGLGAYGREDQVSHMILSSELDQSRTMGTVLPTVFLLVAAFLLNLVLRRMISTQRTEIAVLKAFGYSDAEVGLHFMGYALVAVGAGALVGMGSGVWLGRAMVEMYGEFFDFPTLRYEVKWHLVAIAASISLTAAVGGAIGAVWSAVQLPPAEAMRPTAPTRFKAGLLERLGLGRVLPAAGRMILRNVERRPGRSVFSAIGVAFSVAILIVSLFMFDGVAYMMDIQFRVAQREDLALTFNRPLPPSARYDLAHLDGVTRVETYRVVPVRLRAGHREREAAITGMAPDTRLRRIVTAHGAIRPVPQQGMMISRLIADELGLAEGDEVTVEVLEGARRMARVPVMGIVEDFMGVAIYMRLDELHRLVQGPRQISGAWLTVAEGAREELNARLKRLPAVASTASPALMLAAFEKQLAEGLFISVFFLVGFSSVISVAVIYNGARIALSERGRELASLRVLGFTRRETAVLLLGEQALITMVGIPMGWAVGYGLAALVVSGLQSETYRVPLIVNGETFVMASGVTIVAAGVCGWLVRRRLDRMSLIEVLKTRE